MDVAERWPELAVSVPAVQHELVETLRTDGRSAQVHLQDGQEVKGQRKDPTVPRLERSSPLVF